jgi:hypothetical protein
LDNCERLDPNGHKASEPSPPYERRTRLDNLDRVRRELSVLYDDGKRGKRDVVDVSKLANVLGLMGRLLEGGELRARIDAIEARLQELAGP